MRHVSQLLSSGVDIVIATPGRLLDHLMHCRSAPPRPSLRLASVVPPPAPPPYARHWSQVVPSSTPGFVYGSSSPPPPPSRTHTRAIAKLSRSWDCPVGTYESGFARRNAYLSTHPPTHTHTQTYVAAVAVQLRCPPAPLAIPPAPWGGTVTWPKKHSKYQALKKSFTRRQRRRS